MPGAHRARERRAAAAPHQALVAPSARSARRPRCAWSASRTAWTTTRASSPAVRSSASRSPAPSSTTRRSSSPTSPPAISTARAPTTSSTLLEKLNTRVQEDHPDGDPRPGRRRARHASSGASTRERCNEHRRPRARGTSRRNKFAHVADGARRRRRDPRVRHAAHGPLARGTWPPTYVGQGPRSARATRSRSSCRCPSATSTRSAQVPGVKQATWANWFGGKDPQGPERVLRHASRSTPQTFFDGLRRDGASADDRRRRWLEDRAGRDHRRRRSRSKLGLEGRRQGHPHRARSSPATGSSTSTASTPPRRKAVRSIAVLLPLELPERIDPRARAATRSAGS